MSRAQAKILMRRSIAGAHPVLNEKMKIRYNQRQRAAEEAGLNFRYHGRIVPAHGIRKFLEANNYHTGAHGLCMVCGKEAQVCDCKIIVQDRTGAVIRELIV
jgi:hypothetical protein